MLRVTHTDQGAGAGHRGLGTKDAGLGTTTPADILAKPWGLTPTAALKSEDIWGLSLGKLTHPWDFVRFSTESPISGETPHPGKTGVGGGGWSS